MRAVVVTSLQGPDGVELLDVDEPTPRDGEVLVDVSTVGVSFPDLLLSKGEYQVRPDVPFRLGVDFAGVRRDTGERVACVLPYGGASEMVAVHPDTVFALPEPVSFEQAAALPMNYLTAQFTLGERAGLREGETVLVTGAAGGVGTATVQVAKGYGARVLALVSTPEKAEVARGAGADETIVHDASLRDRVHTATDGRGIDVLVDVVGGKYFTDYLRVLAPQGRLMVVGFAGRAIPEVKVNRLLLNNVDVRGVGWGAYAMVRPGFMQQQWQALLPMIEAGVVDPPLGQVRPVAEVADALREMEERRTLGKTVLTF